MINYVIHGFTAVEEQPVPELNAVLRRYEHTVTGARLAWLDRADDNMSFAIAFRTVPENDTGVFHILEHSVLNGSDQFPTKEPFVELAKGSLQTFLNAFTFPDKTMYPVASRSKQDYLNLIRVYMDAVLHPAIHQKEMIFQQEGWHYELNQPEDTPSVKGVVYNEMKGAFASVDTQAMYELNRLLFPDNCYGSESGGHPAHIPELTYDAFRAAHRRFYHPSNAWILLDGCVPFEEVLTLLDGVLAGYTRIQPRTEIPLQKPVSAGEITRQYEIASEEDEEHKTIFSFGSVYGTWKDLTRTIAMSVLSDVLCGSNEAPLSQAILSSGLGQDVLLETYDGVLQPFAILQVRNTDADKLPQVKAQLHTTLEQLANGELDHDQLRASMNALEFKLRERDFGRTPRGVYLAIIMMEAWLYDGNPAQNLSYAPVFAELREKLDQGYFENLLRIVFLEHPHSASVVMLPSKTLGEKQRKAEQAQMAALKASWSAEQIQQTVNATHALQQAQQTPDSPEALATIPMLKLEDVPHEIECSSIEVHQNDGRTLLAHPLDTSGILYADLYFNASGLSEDELKLLPFLCDALGETATQVSDVLTLQKKIKSHLGDLSFNPEVYARRGETASCTPYVTVSCSLLESEKPALCGLLQEILCSTAFSDASALHSLLQQRKMKLEQMMIMAGQMTAVQRVAAYYISSSAVNELFNGYEANQWVKQTEAHFDERAKFICEQLRTLCSKIFTAQRLMLSFTGKWDAKLANEIYRVLPQSIEPIPECRVPALGIRHEGIQIPADVCFAVCGSNLFCMNTAFSGTLQLAANILSYDYLWNEIRVQGGAYGTGLMVNPGGMASYYSYRDPNGKSSLNCFLHAAEHLRRFCASGASLLKYQIGTVAESDPLMLPRVKGKTETIRWLRGYADADYRRFRTEILEATSESLAAVAPVLDSFVADHGICVVGGAKQLDECGDLLNTRLAI